MRVNFTLDVGCVTAGALRRMTDHQLLQLFLTDHRAWMQWRNANGGAHVAFREVDLSGTNCSSAC
jgi:hypothetical protein